jgi:flagellar secretion chaperone FliS
MGAALASLNTREKPPDRFAMHSEAPVNAYLRTRVLTAAPEELRLMLLDGAIKFSMQAREGLEGKNYEMSYNGFTKAREIILELMNSMRPEVNPDLCAKVSGLYSFMYTELVGASFEKDISRVNRVLGLLEYERETWVLVMKQAAGERTGSAGDFKLDDAVETLAVAAANASNSAQPARRTLSIQG